MKDLIYPHAIRNAWAYGKANEKAVLSKVFGENPDLRSKARDVIGEVKHVVEEVNKLERHVIESELKYVGEAKKRALKDGIDDLPDASNAKITLRFAPNPSGPLHLGHARAAVLNDEHAKKYNGTLILRFEDTDPKRVDPKAYDLIKEDLNWLGVKWHEEVHQSDRLERYYKWAGELVSKKAAYLCTCTQNEFKTLRESGKACKCREVRNSLDDFKTLFSDFEEGEAVLRLKTNLSHKNISIRDFPIMRVVEAKHPLVGDKRVYPLMNLSVAVDDHEMGVTHVLRGKDHILNTQKQAFIYDYLGWNKPIYIHYGLLKILNTVLSTSEMKKGIVEGVYSGWGDVRLGTLQALKRRGIQPKAIRKIMLDVGIKQTDITFSWKNLYAYNKDIIDPLADRYSFVKTLPQPEHILNVSSCPEFTAKNRRHPTIDRGDREVILNSDVQEFLINKDDFEQFRVGDVVRLMGAYNVKIEKVGIGKLEALFLNDSLDFAKKQKAKLINWVSNSDKIPVNLDSLEGRKGGYAEVDINNTKEGDVVQFERFSFVRIERDNEIIRAVETHK